MIEGRKAITTRIRRGKSFDTNSCDFDYHGPNIDVGSNAEGPRGEFDEEVGPRMHIAVACPVKTDRLHDGIQLFMSDRCLQDEIEVGGLVLSFAIDRRASSATQNSANPAAGEGLRDTGCHLGQARS